MGKEIRLPKIGLVKMFQSLRFSGKIVEVTISRIAHRWFVSLIIDIGTPNQVDVPTPPIVGVGVGRFSKN